MAPRSRKYTLGAARMVVAVDHLSRKNWGFDEKIVRKVARQLLQEYDVGDEAWSFIEENNYEELIKGILEFQENDDLGGTSGAGNEDEPMQYEATQNENAEAFPGESSAKEADAEDVSREDTAVAEEKDDDTRVVLPSPAAEPSPASVLVADHAEAAEETVVDDTRVMLPSPTADQPEVAEETVDDMTVTLPSPTPDQRTVIRSRRPFSDQKEVAEETADDMRATLPSPTPPDRTTVIRSRQPSPTPDQTTIIRIRLPCYGWIDENEDESETQELVQLTPAGHVFKVKSAPKADENLGKKRSRWDL